MLEQLDQWVEPEAGFQYLADTTSVHQRTRLKSWQLLAVLTLAYSVSKLIRRFLLVLQSMPVYAAALVPKAI